MLNNRRIHEIKHWTQQFSRIINGRLVVHCKSWLKPQEIYFSNISDPDNWGGNFDKEVNNYLFTILGFTGFAKFNHKLYFFRRNSIWTWG